LCTSLPAKEREEATLLSSKIQKAARKVGRLFQQVGGQLEKEVENFRASLSLLGIVRWKGAE